MYKILKTKMNRDCVILLSSWERSYLERKETSHWLFCEVCGQRATNCHTTAHTKLKLHWHRCSTCTYEDLNAHAAARAVLELL
jgi:hypothetical protein